MATVPSSTTAASAASSSSQYAYPSAGTTSYFPTPFHIQQTPPPPPVPYIGAAPPPTFPVVRLPVYPAPATVYSLPQYHQAQQLFQRDAQTITPEALESVKAALASSDIEHKADTKKKAIPWKAAGQTWEDPTLADWPEMILEMRTSLRRKQSYQRRVCCTNENEAVPEHFDKCKEKQKLTVAPNGRRRPHYLPPRTSFV